MPGSFSDKLMGLLSDPRTMDIGMGLLSQGGPSFQPHNLGQDIAGAYQYANGREGQRQQLEMRRMQMTQQKAQMAQQKRQAEARKQYQGLLSHPAASVPASIRAPGSVANEPAQMQGLLATGYPEQYGQAVMSGLLSQNKGPKNSVDWNDYISSGGDPNDQEAFQAFANPTNLEDETKMSLLLEELRTATEDRKLRNTTYTQGQRSRARSVKNGIATIQGVADAMETVDGTFLAIGAPVPEWRRDAQGVYSFGRELAGFDESQNNKVSAAFDTINKDLSGLLSDTIENFGGNMTVTQIGILKSASANPNIRPETVAGLLMDVLDDRLFTAENEGLDIGELEGMEELRGTLSRIKSGRAGEPKKELDWNDL